MYFWSKIRKLKANYHGSRGLVDEQICKTLQQKVIIEKDPAGAQEKLLQQQSGLLKYHKGLKTEDEKEHFLRHMRKYINIYLPDCPFEVCTTNRYTIETAEACIIARKRIRRGEPIKYLTGIQVEMTEKEERMLCETAGLPACLCRGTKIAACSIVAPSWRRGGGGKQTTASALPSHIAPPQPQPPFFPSLCEMIPRAL